MNRWSAALVIASLAACAGAANADTPAPVIRPGMFAARSAALMKPLAPEQRDERRFLRDAAAASRFEHDAARMALARSNDGHVRSLAATMVNHHADALDTVHRMLQARNMAPPMLGNEQRRVLTHLAKLGGAKFDREWMESVGLRSQQDNVLVFERASSTARDPQLRAWIDSTLPALRSQLQTAERAASGTTKFARLAPQATIKAPPSAAGNATRSMGAAPANLGDLGEGNMVLGPAQPVAVKLTEPNTR